MIMDSEWVYEIQSQRKAGDEVPFMEHNYLREVSSFSSGQKILLQLLISKSVTGFTTADAFGPWPDPDKSSPLFHIL
jgi:hypothetical protein